MTTQILLLISGLILLIGGSNYLLKSAVELSVKLKLSKVVIGLTVVSFATSAPELLISISSALKGSADIAISNVIGSNIFNLGFIFWQISATSFTVTDSLVRLKVSLFISSFIFRIIGPLFRTKKISYNNLSTVLPNISKTEKNKIYYGLGAIKNVGYEAISNIIKERGKNGKFTSLMDFINRVDAKDVNKLQLEGLTKAGVFDEFDGPSAGRLAARASGVVGRFPYEGCAVNGSKHHHGHGTHGFHVDPVLQR